MDTDINHADDDLTPRERRHARTQQAILDAARAIIKEEGVEKLSMRAIADRIDYSPAGLYEYFAGKEEIVGEVCRQGHRLLRRALERVDPALPPATYLVEIGLAYIRFALENPDYFTLIFTQLSAPPLDDSGGLQGHETVDPDSSFPILLQGVERARQAGILSRVDGLSLFEVAYGYWSIVHGIAILRVTYLRDMPIDFSRADRVALEAFGRGMGS